jgi:hypothetical protein
MTSTAPAPNPNDAKTGAAPPAVETVASSGLNGGDDGPLHRCTFSAPMALCRYGDSLFAVDLNLHTVRQIDGVLGVADPLAECKGSAAKSPAEFEERAVPLIRSAVPDVPKELAQLIAQYACGIGFTRTIAGKSGVGGKIDGPAANGALFYKPMCIVVDDTDPVAGPQLIVGERDSGRLRAISLRTRMVSTIAGAGGTGSHSDGPALSRARFAGAINALVVAPTGVLFVLDAAVSVRRLSAAKRPVSSESEAGSPAPAAAPPERVVTTLIGANASVGTDVNWAAATVPAFHAPLRWVSCMALHTPTSPASTAAASRSQLASGRADGAGVERDVGRLYFGGFGTISVVDLDCGERRSWQFAEPYSIVSIVLASDGARLFAVVSSGTLLAVNTRTGRDMTIVRSDSEWCGCVPDSATRSLLMCQSDAHRIVRVRGLDV